MRLKLVRKRRHLLHSLENISLLPGKLYRTSVCWCAFTFCEVCLMHVILNICVLSSISTYILFALQVVVKISRNCI